MAKPLIFVTGFFGSGKTTLLRSLTQGIWERGYSADVILNDFADASLDAATLQEHAASIAPITASCACCGALEELISLCRTAAKASGDVLLIELNGSADPLPILEAFTVSSTRSNFYPRIQVNLIDGRHWADRGRWNPIEKRQLETSGSWILSHQDAISDERKAWVANELHTSAPYAKETDSSKLLDALFCHLEEGNGLSTPDESTPLTTTSSLPRPLSADPVHQLTHHFEGWMVPLPGRVRRRSIEKLLAELPEWVIRAKAVVKLIEHPGGKWLFQRSGTDLSTEPILISHADLVTSSLVCIGPMPDIEILSKLVRKHFGGEAIALQARTNAESGKDS